MNNLLSKIERLEKKGRRIKSLQKIRRHSLRSYTKSHGFTPNLRNPQTFNEKLLFRKLFQRSKLLPLYKFVCKYEVRDFIRSELGEEFLIPLVSVIYNPEDFKLSELPDKFIMKASHGSGWNYIVQDKSQENEEILRKLIGAWLKCNYSLSFTGEAQYEKIRPAIVIEKLLEDSAGKVPEDYKFHCFGRAGKQKIIVQLIGDRFQDKAMTFLTEEWKPLDLKFNDHPNHKNLPNKPDNFEKMLNIARKLSDIYDYCRVDLYSHLDQVYFGEITFIPGNSTEQFKPYSMDKQFGDWMSEFDLTKDSLIKQLMR